MWMGTFGDLMSLLLTFFVLLLSMATFDKKRVEMAIASLEGTFSVLETGKQSEVNPPKTIYALDLKTDQDTVEAENVLASLITEYDEMTKMAQGPSVKLEEAEDGFIVRIPNELLFAKGSAEIRQSDMQLLLKRIALEINKMPNNIHLKVSGHTDNTPLGENGRYGDNWTLSTARALAVTRELQDNRVRPARMAACGEGEYKPVSTNATEEGQANNRRVELYFYSNKSYLRDTAQKVADSHQ